MTQSGRHRCPSGGRRAMAPKLFDLILPMHFSVFRINLCFGPSKYLSFYFSPFQISYNTIVPPNSKQFCIRSTSLANSCLGDWRHWLHKEITYPASTLGATDYGILKFHCVFKEWPQPQAKRERERESALYNENKNWQKRKNAIHKRATKTILQ